MDLDLNKAREFEKKVCAKCVKYDAVDLPSCPVYTEANNDHAVPDEWNMNDFICTKQETSNFFCPYCKRYIRENEVFENTHIDCGSEINLVSGK